MMAIYEVPQYSGYSNLPLLMASDSHSSMDTYDGAGKPLGSRATWIKLSQLTFDSLKWALRNKARVALASPTPRDLPAIIGLCIKESAGCFLKDREKTTGWAIIPFSSELNCLIGARGTGKSTIVDILKFLLDPSSDKQYREDMISRFEAAIVFYQARGDIFAIRMEPNNTRHLNRKIYFKKDSGFGKTDEQRLLRRLGVEKNSNSPVSEYASLKNIQTYKQRQVHKLHKLARDPLGPTIVLELLTQSLFGTLYENLNKSREAHLLNIKQRLKDLPRERALDTNADLYDEYLAREHAALREVTCKLNPCRLETVDKVNRILKYKLELVANFGFHLNRHEKMIKKWVKALRIKRNIVYEEQLEWQRDLKLLFEATLTQDAVQYWAIPLYIYTHDELKLANSTGIDLEHASKICDLFYDKVDYNDVPLLPEVLVDFKLNVNHGVSNRKMLRDRRRLSFCQQAVGMLLLILHAATELGEKRPLVIDQPEDDLDNQYIYHTLAKEFQGIKQTRQLIIATHNPNIPVAGDAENVLVLKSDGEHGWVQHEGGIDRIDISEEMVRLLEGDYEAFMFRGAKYGLDI